MAVGDVALSLRKLNKISGYQNILVIVAGANDYRWLSDRGIALVSK